MKDNRAESVRVARHLFQDAGGGSIPTSALQLWIHQIEYRTARILNECWHSRLPRIGDPPSVMEAGIHFGATFEDRLYAVAIWTHPVNRSLPQDEWLELRRLAVASDAPRNTASRMLSVMARMIRRHRPGIERLISYQDTEVHTGAIYKAAGWQCVTKPRRGGTDGGWTNRTRVRPPSQSTAKKQRWEKVMCEMKMQGGIDAHEKGCNR